MEMTGIQKFKALNDKLPNFKDCEGLIVKPIAFVTSNYDGQDGKLHTKLVILNGNDKQMYKTEVKAFIEKFMQYDEAFSDVPDEEKPEMVITIKTSQKGNKYVSFNLVEEE